MWGGGGGEGAGGLFPFEIAASAAVVRYQTRVSQKLAKPDCGWGRSAMSFVQVSGIERCSCKFPKS